MSKSKGVTLSSWIWMLGGVIIASMIIVFGVTMMIKFQDRNQKIFSIEAYNNLVDRATLVCSQSTGNVDYYRISVPEVVRAIYPANFANDLPPDKVAEDIEELKRARGRYICMQFFDETTARCRDIFNCNITMTYIGTPATKDDLGTFIARLQGKYAEHSYEIILNKTATKHVDMKARRELVIS